MDFLGGRDPGVGGALVEATAPRFEAGDVGSEPRFESTDASETSVGVSFIVTEEDASVETESERTAPSVRARYAPPRNAHPHTTRVI